MDDQEEDYQDEEEDANDKDMLARRKGDLYSSDFGMIVIALDRK